MKRNPQVSFLATGTIIRFTLAIILAIVCGMTYVMFLKNAQRADNYTEITKIMALFLSGACSYIPFTVAEVLVIIVLTVFAVYIVVVVFKIITNGAFFSRLFRLLSNVAIFASFVALLFMAMFGANYFCTPLSSKLELNVRPASVEELKEVTASMLEKANEYSKYVPRDEEGYTSMGNFSSMAERVAGGYRKLGEEYSFLSGSYA
ncbi:MAG: DUF3810 domain-containing protein, partial [Clostridiales bacterium]|nr:DUF3810 domain-containing protein [Clostridiales bacterium]